MSLKICLSTFLLNLELIFGTYLKAESNYLRPQLERNNIVNKGVWVRDPKDRFFERSNGGDFIFRANSLDVDSILQNNFDAFGENGMQDTPGISSYIERAKRSADYQKKRLIRDTIEKCKGEKECIQQNIYEKPSFGKSKFISKLKPTSVFNDYPYEVAILLGDYNKIDNTNVRRVKASNDDNSVIPLNENKEHVVPTHVNIDPVAKIESKVDSAINYHENNSIIPKRSMKNDYESEVIKKIEIIEEVGNENATTKVDRDIFDKEERIWHQNVPISDTNAYKIVPKYPIQKSKPINERGLIKVLSMLTKTFKKIMKQHSDIKKIHSKLHSINDEVVKHVADLNTKFKDMEDKYSQIVAISDKMKVMEANMNLKEEYHKNKELEMSKNLMEFENQQKKFLTQQRQFYNIQKLMLAQNEKINMKQNLIAKTQSEISHRQNNFARILKKAKQIYLDNRNIAAKQYSSTTNKPNINNETEGLNKITHTTTQAPVTTDPIKINLFSIPSINKLVNQDTLILKEKDEHPVDDLVYKYYFNNTFIDNLMKSKVLSTFITTAENSEIARNAKNKRRMEELESTILLPIHKYENQGNLNREKRWIHHISKAKLKRKGKGKNNIVNVDINDEKPLRPKKGDNLVKNTDSKTTILFAADKANPFKIMAKNFCTEIGQNANEQMLTWCIEKALRRLQYMDMKMPPIVPPVPGKPQTSHSVNKITAKSTTTLPIASTVPPVSVTTTPEAVSPSDSSPRANSVFFPDNDELESNLKEYDLKPDTEGTVYYDGSLHASDLVGLVDSGGLSDFMPGLESNSRVEVDPLTFDIQARRRNIVRRVNANIMKNYMYG